MDVSLVGFLVAISDGAWFTAQLNETWLSSICIGHDYSEIIETGCRAPVPGN